RCLYPQPPDPAATPTCATAGVLGPLAGMIGSLQALEVIKCLLNIGDSLAGNLLLVSGLYGLFHKVTVDKNPHCPACC
ncbi:MAG: hypothetical protein G8345_17000, partial [Magnetococcales bacterium]|nr:hypothetical protein [Magnetococcales bacterium]